MYWFSAFNEYNANIFYIVLLLVKSLILDKVFQWPKFYNNTHISNLYLLLVMLYLENLATFILLNHLQI